VNKMDFLDFQILTSVSVILICNKEKQEFMILSNCNILVLFNVNDGLRFSFREISNLDLDLSDEGECAGDFDLDLDLLIKYKKGT